MSTLITLPARHGRRGDWHVPAGLLMSGLTGVYAFAIPRGLPYDEPSHWAFVRFLADEWTLPVIGDARVGYEAQMGPVGYLPGAWVVRVITLLGGSDDMAFYAVRLLGCGLLLGLFLTVRRLASLALPGSDAWQLTVGASLAVFNPMVVAMSLSVQNDTSALLLFLLLLAWVARYDRPPGWLPASGMGALAALVVLAKLSLAPAVAVCSIWFALRFRRQGVLASLAMTVSTSAFSAWWFVRNLALYGDVTGRTAVSRLGLEFPPLGPHPSAVGHLGRSAVVYLTLPVEYFRNVIQAPAPVEAVAVGLVITVVGAGTMVLRGQRRPGFLLLLAVGAASVFAWAVTAVLVQAVAFRTAYAVLPLYAVAAVGALRVLRQARRSYAVAAGLMVGLVSLHAWVLLVLSHVSYGPGLRL